MHETSCTDRTCLYVFVLLRPVQSRLHPWHWVWPTLAMACDAYCGMNECLSDSEIKSRTHGVEGKPSECVRLSYLVMDKNLEITLGAPLLPAAPSP